MAAKQRSVLYVDFGFTSAKEFWREVGMPAYGRFTATQNRGTAIEASTHAWHVIEWVWHDNNPGADTQGNQTFVAFRDGLIAACPELAWVRDIAEAGKHRGLGRSGVVVGSVDTRKPAAVTFGGTPVTFAGQAGVFGGGLTILMLDGMQYQVAPVLATVIAFWEGHFGP